MDSHGSFSSSNTSLHLETERPAPDVVDHSAQSSDTMRNKMENVGTQDLGHIGVLEVYIHQARDIHNICIYHNQDVYAKLCLTNDPDSNFSTNIINGGGRNPVFNEGLQLKVHNVDSSLKCEIWMLSRVRNYLEDQLLGFTLVPVSDILGANGKLVQEFSLSSTDLFHSPAGFVELSLSYHGASPEVVALSGPPVPRVKDPVPCEQQLSGQEREGSVPCELTNIEFPDPKIVNENEMMVSEYFTIPCSELESQSPESLVTTEDGNYLDSAAHGQAVEQSSHESAKESPASSATTNGSSESPATVPNETESTPQSVSNGQDEKPKDVNKCIEDETKINLSRERTGDSFPQPLINIKIEPEQPVVQQDIVDMYMKSMQQFTESLAKMKLPIDIDNKSSTTVAANATNTNINTETENSPTDSKGQPKSNGSRVFYGSRAFF